MRAAARGLRPDPCELLHVRRSSPPTSSADRDVPFVVTFHALGPGPPAAPGRGRRVPRGAARDRGPRRRRGRPDHRRVPAGRGRPDPPLSRRPGPDRGRSPAASTRPSSGRSAKRAARPSSGLDPDERIVLQLGRMVPRKGVDNVIRGLGPAARATTASPPGCWSSAASRAEPDPRDHARDRPPRGRSPTRRAWPTRVTFVGSRGRTSCATTTAPPTSSSRPPGTSRSASRRSRRWPAARRSSASAVGGIKSTVVDGETATSSLRNDPDALADGSPASIRDPTLLPLFGRQAIARVNEMFTWERVVCGIAALYEDVLTTAAAPHRVRRPRAALTTTAHVPVTSRARQEPSRLPARKATSIATTPGGSSR